MADYVCPRLPGKLPSSPAHWPRRGWRRSATWLAIALLLAFTLYFVLIWPWISRWGATDEEVQMAMPGDGLIADALLITTKAITIQAKPEHIWPWLVQLGVDRGGMYSYLWVENWLLHLNVKNIEEIQPGWQSLQPGDFIRFTPKEYPLNPGPGLYVMEVMPEYALVGCFGMEDSPPLCSQSATWQFILIARENNSTRLLLRSHTAGKPTMMAKAGAIISNAFQFYMERKMLLTLKERAETLAGNRPHSLLHGHEQPAYLEAHLAARSQPYR